VSQELAWKVLRRIGLPDEFIGLLKSWADQSRITLYMGDSPQQPFPQEKGVPQGGVLSPIIFNLVLEVLLRYVNAHGRSLGSRSALRSAAAAAAARDGTANAPLPPPLQLLALAYADDVVLICPNRAAAQRALDLVQDWSEHFGFTIGVGAGKTEAMFISAQTVKEAWKNDENGMLRPDLRDPEPPEPDPSAEPQAVSHDDDHSTVLDDDDEDGDDPEANASDDENVGGRGRSPGLRPGQQRDGNRVQRQALWHPV